MIPREPIATARLRLEPLDRSHAEALWEATASSLEELRRWLSWAAAASPEATREFSDRSETSWAAATDYTFAIFEGAGVVGGVGVHTPRFERLGELGYWMRTDRTGRGYTTEAAGAAVAFGFEVLGLYRMELRAGVGNPASRRVAEKLGFTLEGTLRRGCPGGPDGAYDCHLYGLLAEDHRGPGSG